MRWRKRRRDSGSEGADGLSAEQRQEDGWRRAGWTAVWVPTLSNPDGRRGLYWVRQGEDTLLRAFKGSDAGPPPAGDADYYLNGGRVYRDEGHPEGPSSVPYYVVRRSGVYPSEGFPTGPSGRKHFMVRVLRRYDIGPAIRPNPNFGRSPLAGDTD